MFFRQKLKKLTVGSYHEPLKCQFKELVKRSDQWLCRQLSHCSGLKSASSWNQSQAYIQQLSHSVKYNVHLAIFQVWLIQPQHIPSRDTSTQLKCLQNSFSARAPPCTYWGAFDRIPRIPSQLGTLPHFHPFHAQVTTFLVPSVPSPGLLTVVVWLFLWLRGRQRGWRTVVLSWRWITSSILQPADGTMAGGQADQSH